MVRAYVNLGLLLGPNTLDAGVDRKGIHLLCQSYLQGYFNQFNYTKIKSIIAHYLFVPNIRQILKEMRKLHVKE